MATSPASSEGPKLAGGAAYGTFATADVTAYDAERGDDGGDHAGDLLTTAEGADLRRGLDQRHLSMLAIAGAIGTGLFLGLGGAVSTAGPLGALLAYATIGLVVCAVQFALGEAAALLPVTGAFVRHAEFLVDPALGFAVGWNLVYGNILSIPAELTAICVLFSYWWPADVVSPAVWIVIFMALTAAVGFSFVRVFGEVEFVFAVIKILLVVFLIVMGLVIDLGGVPGTERIGFKYWQVRASGPPPPVPRPVRPDASPPVGIRNANRRSRTPAPSPSLSLSPRATGVASSLSGAS